MYLTCFNKIEDAITYYSARHFRSILNATVHKVAKYAT